MNAVPVYIIDDEQQVRTMTSQMVQELGYLNYPFATATDFLDALPHLKPGCVLVDLQMEDMSGIDLIRASSAVRSSFPAILVTGHAQVGNAVEAMQAGALDVLQKPVALDRLEGALAAAFDSLSAHTPPSLEDAAPMLASRHGMTKRQTAVLHALVAGKSNKQIAADLSLSTRTVEMHRAGVMAKLEVNSLPALLRMLVAETVRVPEPPRGLVGGLARAATAPRVGTA